MSKREFYSPELLKAVTHYNNHGCAFRMVRPGLVMPMPPEWEEHNERVRLIHDAHEVDDVTVCCTEHPDPIVNTPFYEGDDDV